MTSRVFRRWVLYWAAVAILAGVVASGKTARDYLLREPDHSRRRTRRVVGQLGPALVAGALLAGAAAFGQRGLTPYLPGLWAMIFGLGIFASRPYLPRATGWAALYYLSAGALLIVFPQDPPGGWTIGGTFAAGQLGTAAVLYANVERTPHGEED